MKCLFCKQDTEFHHREVVLKYDAWECKNCPYNTRIYDHGNGVMGASMVVSLNNNVYAIDMWHPDCPLGVRDISNDGNVETVFTLPFTPDWNPTNIEAKLKTALTFL